MLPKIDVANINDSNVLEYNRNLYGYNDIGISLEGLNADNFFTAPIRLVDALGNDIGEGGTIDDLLDQMNNRVPINNSIGNIDYCNGRELSQEERERMQENFSILEHVCDCVVIGGFRLGASCEYTCEALLAGKVEVSQMGCVEDGSYTAQQLKDKCCGRCKGLTLRSYITRETSGNFLSYYKVTMGNPGNIQCKKILIKQFELGDKCVEYYQWKLLEEKTFSILENSRKTKNQIDGEMKIGKESGDPIVAKYEYKAFFNNNLLCTGAVNETGVNHIIKMHSSNGSNRINFKKYIEYVSNRLEETDDRENADIHMTVSGPGHRPIEKWLKNVTTSRREDGRCEVNRDLQTENNLRIIYRRTDCKRHDQVVIRRIR